MERLVMFAGGFTGFLLYDLCKKEKERTMQESVIRALAISLMAIGIQALIGTI